MSIVMMSRFLSLHNLTSECFPLTYHLNGSRCKEKTFFYLWVLFKQLSSFHLFFFFLLVSQCGVGEVLHL